MTRRAEDFSWPQRVTESYKAKYCKLRNAKKPTGDPTIPDDVKFAKKIARRIEVKFAAIQSDGESEDEDEDTDEHGEYEDENERVLAEADAALARPNPGAHLLRNPQQQEQQTTPKKRKRDLRSHSARKRDRVMDILENMATALSKVPPEMGRRRCRNQRPNR